MVKTLLQYRVFIGSPGGLQAERDCFSKRLQRFTANFSESRNVLFHPVRWEDISSGAGRPQALINEDLKQCDYAVFVLHDRWGSLTGSGSTSGTEEEWNLAEELYKAHKILDIALYFKAVDRGKLGDAGPELNKVLAFKKKIDEEKRYLFKNYESSDEFEDLLEKNLSNWLKLHENSGSKLANLSLGERSAFPESETSSAPVPAPGFDYWMEEVNRLSEADPPDGTGFLFCARRALEAASNPLEKARARSAKAYGHSVINDAAAALPLYEEIIRELNSATELPLREQVGRALVNKGIVLNSLGRSGDAIAAYDEVIARFDAATELPLCEQVANALVNKGVALDALGRSADAVAACDEVVSRFGTATELSLRIPVAMALLNKGVALDALGRSADAIAAFDNVIGRISAATELPLREQVANALVNKGVALGDLDRSADAIAVFDDVIDRFNAATELPLREQVGRALLNKGVVLNSLGRSADAIAVYDEVIARFAAVTELPLRRQVAIALLNKGVALGSLSRGEEAIVVYDDVINRFKSAPEPMFLDIVKRAKEQRRALTTRTQKKSRKKQ